MAAAKYEAAIVFMLRHTLKGTGRFTSTKSIVNPTRRRVLDRSKLAAQSTRFAAF